MKNNIVDCDNARFSVAMIELKSYIELIPTIDKELEEPTYVLNHVLKMDRKSDENLLDILRSFSVVKFAKVQKYLRLMKKNILKYQTNLEAFLQENPKEQQEFNDVLDVLIPLFEEKEKLVNEQLKKCFEYIKAATDIHSV